MNLLRRLARRLGYLHKSQVRRYDAAVVNRLTADWIVSTLTADREICRDLKKSRDRARDLERNNDYVRNWLRALENNVLGHSGITLQSKAENADGSLDDEANRFIEEAWLDWGGKGTCTFGRDLDWLGVQRLVLRSTARDGNAFIRPIADPANPFGFTLQLWESDYLDHTLDQRLPNGGQIRSGIEFAPNGRRAGYWFHSAHPGDVGSGSKLVRFSADEMLHVFMPERIGQSLGITWMSSAITRLNMLGGYEEAELVAARVAASKMGFFTKETPDGWTGEEGADGNKTIEAEPGTFEELPMGLQFQSWDPQHPAASYPFFVKACLRGIASGLGMTYHGLANDLESVNYSSARVGLIEEREHWKMVQAWFISSVCGPIFRRWIESALITGALALDAGDLPRLHAPTWKGRRWPWVDPLKDIQANVTSIEKGLTSRRAVIAEQGGDVEDVFDDIAADQRLAEEKGIDLKAADPQPPQPRDDSKEEGIITGTNGEKAVDSLISRHYLSLDS